MSLRMTEHFIKGTCSQMCPFSEIVMREREGLLHKFEIQPGSREVGNPKADHNRMVKKYARCAAGQATPKASELRTYDALKKTISYLLEELVVCNVANWSIVYDYVFDRLCAVRQDAVIQDFNIQHSIDILKPIVRFLAYSGYRLCEEPLQKYDPSINNHHFTDCLKKLLRLYDYQWRQAYLGISNSLNINEQSQFEAMYQITFLGNPEVLYRGLALDQKLRTHPLVNLAIEISFAHSAGNYVRVCKKLLDLPPLLLCVAALHLPKIRRNALLTMNVAFSTRNLNYPLASLFPLLLYDNEQSLRNECQYYGLVVKNQGIIFQKGSFKEDSPLVVPSHQKCIDDVLRKYELPILLMKNESYIVS